MKIRGAMIISVVLILATITFFALFGGYAIPNMGEEISKNFDGDQDDRPEGVEITDIEVYEDPGINETVDFPPGFKRNSMDLDTVLDNQKMLLGASSRYVKTVQFENSTDENVRTQIQFNESKYGTGKKTLMNTNETMYNIYTKDRNEYQRYWKSNSSVKTTNSPYKGTGVNMLKKYLSPEFPDDDRLEVNFIRKNQDGSSTTYLYQLHWTYHENTTRGNLVVTERGRVESMDWEYKPHRYFDAEDRWVTFETEYLPPQPIPEPRWKK